MAAQWLSRRKEAFLDGPALNTTLVILLLISGYATWSGLDGLLDVRGDITHIGIFRTSYFIGGIVAVLTVVMYLSLREVLKRRGQSSPVGRILGLVLYLLLSLWSVGFGYGFWWSVLSGSGASDDSLRAAISALEQETAKVQGEVSGAAAMMANAVTLSELKAEQEINAGGTCGIGSPRGEGPLLRARLETRAELSAIAKSLDAQWARPLSEQLTGMTMQLADTVNQAQQSGSRRPAFEQAYGLIKRTAVRTSAQARAQGEGFAHQLLAKASRLDKRPENGEISYCYDPDLAASLRQVASGLRQDFDIHVPDLVFSDGAEGIALAIEKLWTGMAGQILPSLTSDRPSAGRWTLRGREIIALLAAIAVDLSIFVFAVFQAARKPAPLITVTTASPMKRTANRAGGNTNRRLPSGQMPVSKDGSKPVSQSKVKLASLTYEEAADQAEDPTAAMDNVSPSYERDLNTEIKNRIDKYRNNELAARAGDLESRREAQMDMAKLRGELELRGVTPFAEVGEPAVEGKYEVRDKRKSFEPIGEILEVIHVGFVRRDGQLIRPAAVIVSAGASSPDEAD